MLKRSFKRNYKRNRFRNNGERNYHKNRNGGGQNLSVDLSNDLNFRRLNKKRNNQNASQLSEKYTNLAKEALTNGDKILYENYLQHADHFLRLLAEKENNKNKDEKNNENLSLNEQTQKEDEKVDTTKDQSSEES